ncbi:MAG: hypothetical protein KBE23_05335 [Chloroflexi bacterium]|nr:hypothetical protein [Chloroflexota bacterium]MBP7042143.1 hypothetical protein [Chloroflexota bacterium]
MKQKTRLQDKENQQKWVLFRQTVNPGVNPEALRLMNEMGDVFRSANTPAIPWKPSANVSAP